MSRLARDWVVAPEWRPLVIGHRGVRGEGAPPENTMAAFEAAASEGADGIELDVRLCKTGELVAAHDETLERVTGGADRRAIAELSYAELRRVDLGGGARVPLAAEVLALARARGLLINVEMKRDAPDRLAIAAATARLVRGFHPARLALVSSFDPAMLAAFGWLAPHVPRALLLNHTWYAEPAAPVASPLGARAVHIERTLASPPFMSRLRRRGLLVSVWTVNDPREAVDLRELGVHALITDAPGAVLRALAPT